MKLTHLALVVALSAVTSFVVGKSVVPSQNTATPQSTKSTAYQRVMETRTVRCAYVVRPPHIFVDPNTKQISGIDHDLIEEIGKAAGLKIEWVEEVGFGTFPEHLNSGKQDAFCSLVLISARRAQRVELSQAVTFMPLHAYAREGDTRFDNDLGKVNVKDVKIAVIDGSSQKAATDSAFPNASQYAVPGDADVAQTLLAVTTGKADVVTTDENMVHDYNRSNPTQQLRRIASEKPIRTYGEAFAFAKGETELRDLFNAAIQEMIGNGFVERIITKYETTPDAILRTAQPYAQPNQKGTP